MLPFANGPFRFYTPLVLPCGQPQHNYFHPPPRHKLILYVALRRKQGSNLHEMSVLSCLVLRVKKKPETTLTL
ncbi:Hypothetical protein, putative [Bodo saltans]|uniref:Uncharacterized protein n=1 Tax=Bodo saltans TaxID=75058 RepID=A0A0S4JKN3_BODSA|nr:Hypothetical protein, putative [Bodo saltans]|eukprot:CUG89745.1 Hypothetical protein, putative [Bodo saltans]